MSRETLIDLLYLFSATTFVLALKGLGSPKRARYGNMVAAFGMIVAVVATFFKYVDGHPLHHVWLILLAMLIGVLIAVPVARFVKMTAMPQLVAIFNGVGGGAACLVSITEFVHIKASHPATYVILEVLLGVLIGTVSFSGSAIAFAKLQELMTGRPVTYPAQQVINAAIGAIVNLLLLAWIWHLRARPEAQWRKREISSKERRSEKLQVVLAIVTLLLVGLETWTHTLVHRKAPAPPAVSQTFSHSENAQHEYAATRV